MTVMEVVVGDELVQVYRGGQMNGHITAEGMGLEIEGDIRVSRVDPGILAVRGQGLKVYEKNETVHIEQRRPTGGFL